MIYLDNAATTYPKPVSVLHTAEKALYDYGANPGRSGHRLSLETSKQVFGAREKCAEFFGGETENTVFTLNCTHAINFAVKGVCQSVGHCHVITSDLEHNSVIRPLHALYKQKRISYSIADSGNSDSELLASLERLIRRDTAVIVITAGCNVNGRITPLSDIAALCRRHNICLIADCAQAAGVIPLSLSDGINIICAPGHKGLYGPMGTGVLVTDGKFPLSTLIEGGTGSASGDINQPDFLPDSFESGTINTPGAIALGRGVEFVTAKGIDRIYTHEMSLCELFVKRCESIKSIKLYRCENAKSLPVVSFTAGEETSSITADMLSQNGFYLRGGLHCNFLAHKKQGTLEKGTVRLAPSVFNTRTDIIKLTELLYKKYGGKSS